METYEDLNDFADDYISPTVAAPGIRSANHNAILKKLVGQMRNLLYDSTRLYTQDEDVVIYNSVLYVCNTTITVAESWNSSKWTALTGSAAQKERITQNDSAYTGIDSGVNIFSHTRGSQDIIIYIYDENQKKLNLTPYDVTSTKFKIQSASQYANAIILVN